jgi:nucleotide-binding universal stress UspA family protein
MVKVLIGTDGSDEALGAAITAFGLLAPPEAIVVTYVVEAAGAGTEDLGSGFGSAEVTDPAELERGWASEHTAARDAIDRLVQALDVEADIEQVIEHGDAGAALCRLAEERGVQLLVVGSRGHGVFRRALLGSVSSYAVNNAPCPVFVVRRGNASAVE